MSKAWRQEDVDTHYTRFFTQLRDEESLEAMVAPVIQRFAEHGLRTAIVTEKSGEEYVFHCLAVRLVKGDVTQVVSQQVDSKTLDDLKLASVRKSEIEPLGISFGPPRF